MRQVTVDVIVTHDVTDFDGIAAAVAARRLHPGAVMLRRRIISADVRAYLAVHGDRFAFEPFESIDPAAVRRFIMVDVRRRSRLVPDFAAVLGRADAGDPDLELHVYDHHPDSDDDVHGSVEVVEPTGAVTTLFTEILRDRGERIDPVEATLFALGIYSDTGSLTYASTRPRDARAVAWLLEQGASVELVSRFNRPRFTAAQRALLSRFLDGLETHRIGAEDVGIAVLPLRRSISAMPLVTTQVCQLSSPRTVFGVFPVGSRRVQIIGRSDHGGVDVGEVMKSLGGGGHPDAGSTTLRDVSGDRARELLLAELRRRPSDSASIRRWMRAAQTAPSSGEPNVTPAANLDEVLDLMARRDLARVHVVEDGRVCGVVERADLMAALYEG